MRRTIQSTNFLGMPAVLVSQALRQIMEVVERVAKTNAAVLITGESGCGKEMIARAVHHYSLRCNRPWVDVSCAALPEHLMESELFGHEKGAFSGAESGKQGLFELAHTGTFFMDEVGELDPKMQVKLLRVLDGIPYYRLGGVRKVSVDVRVVAATNQDLETLIEQGRFRNDLFHRLNQVHIQVPPLRYRLDAIEALANFLLQQINGDLRFSGDAIDAFKRHSWPGNIRELRNVISKAAVIVRGSVITAADVELRSSSKPAATAAAASSCSLDEMERRMVLDALQKTGGHRQRAADLLGISRRTLTRRLKIYGISEEGPASVAAGWAIA
jgi:DNA-binding NtrC family response regulator